MEIEDKNNIQNELLKEKLRKARLENDHYNIVNSKQWLQSKLIIQAIIAGIIFSGSYFFLMNPILQSYKSIANEKSEVAILKSDQARIKALIALENNTLQKLISQKNERELVEENRALEDSFSTLKNESLKNKSLYISMEKELSEFKKGIDSNNINNSLSSTLLISQAHNTLSIMARSTDKKIKEEIINEYFTVAKTLYDELTKIKLTLPIKKSLKYKKEKMQSAIKLFTLLSDSDVPTIKLASIYYIAQIYINFSHSLLSSERPNTLSVEELDQYDVLLQDQAYPFEDKAIEFFEVAYGRYKDALNLDDRGIDYLDKTKSMLLIYFPSKYAPKVD